MDKKISIFSGAHCVAEKKQYYFDIAYQTGKLLAQNGFSVASGAGPGLMDEVLRGANEAGGETIGIMLNLKNRHQSKHVGSSTLFDKLGPRQDKMISIGDAYIALPGGVGTLFEIYNILALKRINELPAEKPLILIGSYYDGFKKQFEKMIADGFASEAIHTMYHVVQTPEAAIEILKKYFHG